MGRASDGTYFFCMKLVGGQSLSQLLKDLRRHTAEQGTQHDGTRLLRHFLKICDAVEFAHSRGIVHRDLKPANIMIGSFGEVLVMDWGLAKTATTDESPDSPAPKPTPTPIDPLATPSPHLTADGEILGTPVYMAPEQAEGRLADVDHRSDVYSLGVILYEILALEIPFAGSDTVQILSQVSQGNFPPPSHRSPDAFIPHDLEAVVMKAMNRSRTERYPDATSLKADLETFLEGRPLQVASYNPVQRMRKWIGRHRTVSVAVVSMTLLLILTVFVQSWRRDRDEFSRFQLALVNGRQHRQDAGDIRHFVAPLPQLDPKTGQEYVETREQRARRETAIRTYLKSLRAFDVAAKLRPNDPEVRQELVATGLAVAQMAQGARNWLLAEEFHARLQEYGYAPDQVEKAVASVRDQREARKKWRRDRILFILGEFERGLSSSDRFEDGTLKVRSYMEEVKRYRDHQTIDLLAVNIQRILKQLESSPQDSFTREEMTHLRFICQVLGALDLPECVSPLETLLLYLMKSVAATRGGSNYSVILEVAKALCHTRRPEALFPLLALQRQLGSQSPIWANLEPYLSLIPESQPTDPRPNDSSR
ncbi:MAG: serine/threonine-protein kinase [Planctomycetota bacterium]|jgi:hypothetical protein|nr:serine/threonine-protein kinase [Planctomycetota bacterium]